MKTRQGFVSNSSSSSFVVAFPKKPKTVNDVLQMTYKGNVDFVIGNDFNDKPILAYDAAKSIFDQIQDNRKATLKDITEEFRNRYYYDVCDNVYSMDKYYNLHDEHGWGTALKERYFGKDKKALDELANVYIEKEKEYKLKQEKLNTVITAYLTKKKYPLKYTGDINDKKSFKAYWTKYHKHMDAAKNTEEYKKVEAEFPSYTKYFDEIHRLTMKVAKADAKSFMNDNKDAYIAILTYSDNDGDFGCVMEHGETFVNLPHVRVSHH